MRAVKVTGLSDFINAGTSNDNQDAIFLLFEISSSGRRSVYIFISQEALTLQTAFFLRVLFCHKKDKR